MTMPGVLTCTACNRDFLNRSDLRAHHRSDWHRINLHRKVAGLGGLIKDIFEARLKALQQEKLRKLAVPRLYSCLTCKKHYVSRNALDQHFASKSHQIKFCRRLSKLPGPTDIKSFPSRHLRDDGLLQVGVDSAESMNKNAGQDASCCFICDAKGKSVKSCMAHMHREHGFFIPDVEYLKDVNGFLTYLGLKVKRDFRCLYCNERRSPFRSLEAVRKHMIDKAHCKVRYDDGDEEEDGALDEFYDYSSSYVGAEGNELRIVELGLGGLELIIGRKREKGISVRSLGSRQLLRYYRQKPRPSIWRNLALRATHASRYRSMVQREKQMVQRAENRAGVEAMRSLKSGMKKKFIRSLSRNLCLVCHLPSSFDF